MQKLISALILLLLIGCSTEEKPIYLYCFNEDWGMFGDRWLIIDKANRLWIFSSEDPQNRPEDHKLYVARLFEDEAFYRPVNAAGNVSTGVELDRRSLVFKSYGDFNVFSECEITDPIPEFRAEGLAQKKLPKI